MHEQCKQLVLGLQNFHTSLGVSTRQLRGPQPGERPGDSSVAPAWSTAILPFVEDSAVYDLIWEPLTNSAPMGHTITQAGSAMTLARLC